MKHVGIYILFSRRIRADTHELIAVQVPWFSLPPFVRTCARYSVVTDLWAVVQARK
jgi:hypothetical protein